MQRLHHLPSCGQHLPEKELSVTISTAASCCVWSELGSVHADRATHSHGMHATQSYGHRAEVHAACVTRSRGMQHCNSMAIMLRGPRVQARLRPQHSQQLPAARLPKGDWHAARRCWPLAHPPNTPSSSTSCSALALLRPCLRMQLLRRCALP